MLIQVKNYPVFMKVGYFPSERARPQEVKISLEVKIRPILPVAEKLENTLDYGALLALLDRKLIGSEVKLLESLCEIIGNTILEAFQKTESVKVTVEKLSLPNSIGKGANITVSAEFHAKQHAYHHPG